MVRFNRIATFSFPYITHRLPEHYYRHVQELKKPSTRVHDQPPKTDLLDLRYNEEKARVERIPDMPIPAIYPKEADTGLWGGEGIIKGYIKPRKYMQAGVPRPKMWFPKLMRVVLYSEILDKHFNVICTRRTLTLIDDHYGLDGYILRSKVQDLKSQLALLLRRQMLLALAKRDFNDEKRADEMLEKYADCVIPLEEAEWFGLPEYNALLKLKFTEAKQNVKIPLKYEYTRKLLETLEEEKNQPPPPEKGLFSRLKSTIGLS